MCVLLSLSRISLCLSSVVYTMLTMLCCSRRPQEEAFALWREWSLLYAAASPARAFLRDVTETRWLVSIVHHDYKDRDGLWKWLLALKAPQ